jgi:hypothetical protein
LAGVVFLCRLWQDSTDFSLDAERLRAAVSEIEANGDASGGEIEVVVPLRGLRMEATRIDLATATIVRADTVDVPAEARASEASGGAGWEPTFLAVTRVAAAPADADDADAGPDAGTRSVEAFRILITTLRLFKEGGVALGPHAWTRRGSGRWRRIATGAGRPRPGGYRLAESELAELAAFARAVASRPVPLAGPERAPLAGALGRSVTRFEAGLERTAALDALNDYLLALRFLLEGGGPAELGLGMRVASLCADPDGRSDVKATIDRAVALERELWSGEPPTGPDAETPAETAAAVEDLARAILKDAACGHLGADLRATADEILLADGLAVGDGESSQRGGTAEWGPDQAADDEEAEVEETQAAPIEAVGPPAFAQSARPAEPLAAFEPEEILDAPRYGRDEPVVPTQRELWLDGTDTDDDDMEVQVIRQPDRISVERTAPAEEETMSATAENESFEDRQPTRVIEPVEAQADVPDDASPVVRLLAIHSAEREATAARVANLFPRPETTEWDVREVSYDRTRRAQTAQGS